MTIRRRLALAFLGILLLFAANQAIYMWSARLRSERMQALDRALTRQVVIATIRQEIDNLHKEVTLLSQVQMEEGAAPADPEDRRQFAARLEAIGGQIRVLLLLSEPGHRAELEPLDQTYRQLADAWKSFYERFGVAQSLAVAQLIRADPLSRKLVTELMPQLQAAEKARVQEAEAQFNLAASRTELMTIGIFVFSALIGATLAYLFSRHLTNALGELKLGAAIIGGMTLDHRIAVSGRDELADLAGAFNDMADKLQSAQSQVLQAKQEIEAHAAEVDRQRQLAETLLLNILPPQVAQELETKGSVDPKYFEDVTILFTDFVGFTLSTEKLAAEDLVHILHQYFTAFDQIVARYHLEKLKTIGDSYMCVGGLPLGRRKRRSPSHPVDTVLAAFEMVNAVAQLRQSTTVPVDWAVRIGIHTGPVVAGVVGIQKFAFDIWGDTVNYASRMESAGEPGRINMSGATYSRIKDFFECEHRGKVHTKEKKEFDMYFTNGLLPALADDPTQSPPPAFLRRYRIYFQKEPPAFPASLGRDAGKASAVGR